MYLVILSVFDRSLILIYKWKKKKKVCIWWHLLFLMINLFDRIKYSDKSDQSNGLLKARSAEHERWLTSFSRFSCCLNYILFKLHILRYILSGFLTAAALSTLSAKSEQDKITNNKQFIWGHLVGWGGGWMTINSRCCQHSGSSTHNTKQNMLCFSFSPAEKCLFTTYSISHLPL